MSTLPKFKGDHLAEWTPVHRSSKVARYPMIKCLKCGLMYDNDKGSCPHCSSKSKPGLLKRQRQRAHDSDVFSFHWVVLWVSGRTADSMSLALLSEYLGNSLKKSAYRRLSCSYPVPTIAPRSAQHSPSPRLRDWTLQSLCWNSAGRYRYVLCQESS